MKSFATALLLLLAVPSTAIGSTRIAIVLDEYVDGQKQASTLVTALQAQFSGHDEIVLVDAEQATKIRAAANGKPLLQADGRALVSASDADKLVIGEVRIQKEKSLIKHLTVYQATATIRVLATDTAQIDASILESARGQGRGVVENGPHMVAVRRAVTKLAKKARPSIEAAVLPKMQRYQVRVALSTPLAIPATSPIVECVKRATGVEAKRIGQTPTELLIEFKSRQGADDLATALSKERRCPLFVNAFSQREIRADYSIKGVATLAVARFSAKGKAARKRRWLAREFPTVIRASLAEVGSVKAGLDQPLVSKTKAVRKKARKLALIGSYSVRGDSVEVQAEVRATWGKRALATESASCKLNEVGTCAIRLGEALAKALPVAVQQNLEAIPLETFPGDGDSIPLAIDLTGAEQIYPARYGHYKKAGIAEVVLTNSGSEKIEDLLLEGELVGFGDGPIQSKQPISIDAKGTKKVRLEVNLDDERLKKMRDTKSAILKVSARYRVGDYTYPWQDRVVGVIVLGRNALSWEPPESIAAFVTSESVRDVVDQVRPATDSSARPIEMPVALFHIVSRLKYITDPSNPWAPKALDYVFYPRETLARGGGDCDDLAVLYASLLEEASVPTVLITTPNHVLVGIDAAVVGGVQPYEDKKMKYVEFNGRRWIPVETTKVGSTFDEAWEAAVARLGNTPDDKKKVVVVQTAWLDYPAKDLAPEGLKSKVKVSKSAIGKVLAAREKKWEAVLAKWVKKYSDEGSASAANALGIIYARQQQLDKARVAFKESLQRAKSADAQNNLGNLQVLKGQNAEALAHYEDALKMDPMDSKRIEILLNAIVASGRMDKSDPKLRARRGKLYATALQLDGKRVRAFMQRLPSSDTTSGSDVSSDLAFVREELEALLKEEAPMKKASNVSDDQLLRFLHWIN